MEKRCSSKSEILRVRSWCSIHDLACERVSQYLIKLFSLAKMCIGSDLSTLCTLGHKLMHRIIRDTLHCPDPAKMGAASPREFCMYGLPKRAVFTAQPVTLCRAVGSSQGSACTQLLEVVHLSLSVLGVLLL